MAVETGYHPRPHQAVIHRSLKRFNVLVCHRRFGKTVLCVNELIDRALRLTAEGRHQPRLAYIAPTYRQAKSVAWDWLKTFTRAIPGRQVHEDELRVDFPGGARITLYGADNPDALRGLYLDWVVLDEYAQMRPRLWAEVVRPALSDRAGGAVFIGTPMGRNQFWQVYRQARSDPTWFAALYKASETDVLPPAELAAARRDMTAEQYEQEFECSFNAGVVGAYYGRELAAAEAAGRVGRVPWEPALAVETWWDLGIDDATAIWFAQAAGREVRLIDYYEATGAGLDHYAKVLRDKPYVYGRHVLPPDARVRELGTGRSRVETLAALGIRATLARQQTVEDGINAARLLLPRCWFDEAACRRGLEALQQYRADWDEKRQTPRPVPLHDWCFVGDTEILTRCGTQKIVNLPKTGEVLTQCGWKPYHSPRVTRRNARLVEVAFADGVTVKCSPDHLFKTEDGWRYALLLRPGTPIQSSSISLHSTSTVVSTAYGRAIGTIREVVRNCTEMFGRRHSARFRRVATSIIAMATQPIMLWRIWSACRQANTYQDSGMKQGVTSLSISLRKPVKGLKIGINRKKAACGIGGTPNGQKAGQNGNGFQENARNVEFLSKLCSERVVIAKNTAVNGARWPAIESVRLLRETADVWCLTVPGEESFCLSNGALVHNCSHAADAFRYGAISLRPDRRREPPARAVTGYSPLDWGRSQRGGPTADE